MMRLSLSEALGQVELEAGRVYRCRVNNLEIELRVKRSNPDLLPAPFNQSDVMVDPWTDLPGPEPLTLLRPAPGDPPLPDISQLLAGDDTL